MKFENETLPRLLTAFRDLFFETNVVRKIWLMAEIDTLLWSMDRNPIFGITKEKLVAKSQKKKLKEVNPPKEAEKSLD